MSTYTYVFPEEQRKVSHPTHATTTSVGMSSPQTTSAMKLPEAIGAQVEEPAWHTVTGASVAFDMALSYPIVNKNSSQARVRRAQPPLPEEIL